MPRFHTPLSEPDGQVSKHPALQRLGVRGSASLHLADLAPSHPRRLPPFAMRPALPASDYYEGSVAIGLVPRRRSRLPTRPTSERVFGAPFAPLSHRTGGRSPGGRLPRPFRQASYPLGPRDRRGGEGRLRTAGGWGSSNPAFTMSRGSGGAIPYTSSGAPASTACCCPLGLSPPGEPLTRRCRVPRCLGPAYLFPALSSAGASLAWPCPGHPQFFRTSPACGRNRSSDEAAHRNEATAPGHGITGRNDETSQG
jgi:hypothetical protein